jgi:hypothetical protein
VYIHDAIHPARAGNERCLDYTVLSSNVGCKTADEML